MNMKIDCDRLIELIQERPTLWDIFDVDYGSNKKRRILWKEIVELLGGEEATEDEKCMMEVLLIRRWKNLRDRYVRVVFNKKLQRQQRQSTIAISIDHGNNNNVSASSAQRKYKYADQMKFLDETLMERKRCRQMKEFQWLNSNFTESYLNGGDGLNVVFKQDESSGMD